MVMFALPLFWSDKHPNPNDRSRDNAIRVLRLDVFTDEMVPKDNQNWRDADEDDWWCLVFPEESPFHVSKMDSNSTCQSLISAMIFSHRCSVLGRRLPRWGFWVEVPVLC